MRILLFTGLCAALAAPSAALAAKPLTQKQFAEQRLKVEMTAWAKKNIPGLEIGKVTCVLPRNGNVVHCTVASTAPKYRENITFQVREVLSQAGTMTWTATSRKCTDSKTGRPVTPC